MRYGNGVIRQLLRRLKRPAELESLPLGKALRQALGAPSAFEAARIAIDNAFAACGPAGERYHKIIWSYDVERTITREEAAEELAVSPRHFFRLRAEAVQAFSDYIALLVDGPPAMRDPINDARTRSNVTRKPARTGACPVDEVLGRPDLIGAARVSSSRS